MVKQGRTDSYRAQDLLFCLFFSREVTIRHPHPVRALSLTLFNSDQMATGCPKAGRLANNPGYIGKGL